MNPQVEVPQKFPQATTPQILPPFPTLPPLNVLPSDMCARLASYVTDGIVRCVTGLG
jgi:hypothetical protein